jgi:hypothetical protein
MSCLKPVQMRVSSIKPYGLWHLQTRFYCGNSVRAMFVLEARHQFRWGLQNFPQLNWRYAFRENSALPEWNPSCRWPVIHAHLSKNRELIAFGAFVKSFVACLKRRFTSDCAVTWIGHISLGCRIWSLFTLVLIIAHIPPEFGPCS